MFRNNHRTIYRCFKHVQYNKPHISFTKMSKRLISRVSDLNTYRGLLRATQRCVEDDADQPIVFILGSTGVGKTKLSIELAKRFNGEVISADSMQVYKGLDIATNKATEVERSGIKHHCFDYVDPYQQHTVIDFRRDSTAAIHDIISRGKLPIVVGGTNYYIECLLFSVGASQDLKSDNHDMKNISKGSTKISSEPPKTLRELFEKPIVQEEAEQWPNEVLHKFLMECDPKSAEMTPPTSIRKIIRFLQIYQQNNRPASDIYSEQKASDGRPVFSNAIIFRLDCERETLHKRLETRCDEMIHGGLLKELSDFHAKYNADRVSAGKIPDYTDGIFQTIGLKEFHSWLLLSEEERNSYAGSLQLGKCILLFKARTKGYVPRQMKWIERRFLTSNKSRVLPNIYRLDTTKLEEWHENVLEKAIKIFQIHLELILNIYPSQKPRLTCLLNAHAEKIQTDEDFEFVSRQYFCNVCKVHVSGGKSYESHLKSKAHRYNFKELRTRLNEDLLEESPME